MHLGGIRRDARQLDVHVDVAWLAGRTGARAHEEVPPEGQHDDDRDDPKDDAGTGTAVLDDDGVSIRSWFVGLQMVGLPASPGHPAAHGAPTLQNRLIGITGLGPSEWFVRCICAPGAVKRRRHVGWGHSRVMRRVNTNGLCGRANGRMPRVHDEGVPRRGLRAGRIDCRERTIRNRTQSPAGRRRPSSRFRSLGAIDSRRNRAEGGVGRAFEPISIAYSNQPRRGSRGGGRQGIP